VPSKDQKKINDHLIAITLLRGQGLTAAGVIGGYHSRRIVPLIYGA
jgi:hypothetical protein